MLKNLFRPKWQHENPEVRKTAISNLGTDGSNNDILEKLALHDKDPDVRQHAISKIDNPALLERIMQLASTKNEQEFALKCWVSILTNSKTISALAVEEYILDCQNETLLGGIVTYCDNNNLRELALSGMKESHQLLTLMSNTKNGGIWQTIIEKLSDEIILKQALAIVNGRDKKSQQAIKHKLETIKSGLIETQQLEEQAEYLRHKLQHLIESDFSPLFEGTLLTCKQQTQDLKNRLTHEKNSHLENLIFQCNGRLKLHQQKKIEAARAEQQFTLDHAAHYELLAQLNTLKSSLLSTNINITNTTQNLSHIHQQWQSISISAPKNEQSQFNRNIADINSILDAHKIADLNNFSTDIDTERLSNLNFAEIGKYITQLGNIVNLLASANIDKKSEFFIHIKSLLENCIKHKNQLEKQIQSLHKDIQNSLDETENFIDKKDLKQAQSVFAKTRTNLGKLSEHESNAYKNRTQRISNAIKALENWKNDASDEKRKELCIKMKTLASDNSDLQAKANSIKEIQSNWKALGHCQNQALWQQFKSYTDEAYQPCLIYFDEQKKIREFNTQQRITICEQLENFIASQDWNNVDWKALDRLLKAIQNEWKKYSSTNHEYHQKLQDRFFSNIRLLKDKINEERQVNGDKLATLVAQAGKLINSSDIHQAIDDYLKLQHQWKSVGITFYKIQHEQWKCFKIAGDALYEKRDNLRQEADHECQTNLIVAEKICKDITQLAMVDDDELANSRPIFDTLTFSFKSLGSLPKDKIKSCQQAFETACTTYLRNVSGIGDRQRLKYLDTLVTISNEWRIMEEKGEIPSIAAYSSMLPEQWLKQLSSRFTCHLPENPSENARILCIEIESLANINTPNEDAALKMQWQMSNLAKKFGQSKEYKTKTAKLEDLYIRWYSQKCWNKEEYQVLEKRFLNAAQTLQKNNPAGLSGN